MATPTVDIQSKPTIFVHGSRGADVVIITSTFANTDGGIVEYQIKAADDFVSAPIVIDNRTPAGINNTVLAVSRARLKIILPFRRKYKVRVKRQFAGGYGPWVTFKTRDKKYSTPDAITSLTDDSDATSLVKGNRTIVVTNNALSVEADKVPAAYNTPRNWGAVTVTNSDTVYNDGQLQLVGNGVRTPVWKTARGATIVNVQSGKNTPIVFTNRGATITNN